MGRSIEYQASGPGLKSESRFLGPKLILDSQVSTVTRNHGDGMHPMSKEGRSAVVEQQPASDFISQPGLFCHLVDMRTKQCPRQALNSELISDDYVVPAVRVDQGWR